jgi:site-specific DNA recombinase
MRLIGYIRVSRVAGREGASFISPSEQHDKIALQAELRGHEVVEWVEDLDEPGSKYQRPGFQRALEMVEGGQADGLSAARLDRFARSVTDGREALRRLQEAGGSLVLVSENLDTTTPIGKAMFTIMLAFAELELDRTRENWATAGSRFAARGGHVCTVAPVGYRKAQDGRLELDPEAAPIVREAFQRRAGGASWNELCAFLDERLPRENGGAWSRSTVASLIARRTYLGEARGGGVVNTDAHPALVTRGEFEAANVAQVDGRHSRGSDGGALLAGLLRCAGCGGALSRVSNGARGYHNYKCKKRNGSGVCEAPAGISASRADAYVEQQFQAELERKPLAIKGRAVDGSSEQAVAALEAAESELSEYRDANLVSIIGRDAYVEGLSKRQQAVEAARRSLADATVAAPFEQIRDLSALWPGLDVRQRRQLLGSVLDGVVVTAAPGAGKGAAVEDRMRLVWR